MSTTELPLTTSAEWASDSYRIQALVREDFAPPGIDLFRLRPVAALLRWPGFPYVFQTGLLAVFVSLAVLPMAAVSVVAIVLVLTAAWFALRELRLTQAESHRDRLPVLALAGCFLFVVFGWGFLQ